jgi:RNA polymerase sigma factor (sigma-70 family)
LSPFQFGCNQEQSHSEQDWTDVRPDEAELKALMTSALDGDQYAYRQLLRRLVPILRQYLGRRVVSGPEDVEDIVQETLLAIDTRRITYDRARPFTPWVFAIAHHKFVDLVRRGRATTVLTDDLIGEHGSGDAIMAGIDVGNLLDTLPPKQAEAIRAVKLDGLSVAEAADRQNIGESDIKVSIHRGLKSLMQKIGRQ